MIRALLAGAVEVGRAAGPRALRLATPAALLSVLVSTASVRSLIETARPRMAFCATGLYETAAVASFVVASVVALALGPTFALTLVTLARPEARGREVATLLPRVGLAQALLLPGAVPVLAPSLVLVAPQAALVSLVLSVVPLLAALGAVLARPGLVLLPRLALEAGGIGEALRLGLVVGRGHRRLLVATALLPLLPVLAACAPSLFRETLCRAIGIDPATFEAFVIAVGLTGGALLAALLQVAARELVPPPAR